MSNDSKIGATRRESFRAAGYAAAGAVVAASALVEPAQAKMTLKAVKYQPIPQGLQSCAKCARFVAGKPPAVDGTCTIVDGNISPEGWCAMYVPKS